MRYFSQLLKNIRPNFTANIRAETFLACTDRSSPHVTDAYRSLVHCNHIHEAIERFVKAVPLGPREYYFYAIEQWLAEKKELDLNVQDAQGNSVLHRLAKYRGHPHAIYAMALTLLNHGINPNLVNQAGKSAAHLLFETLSHTIFEDNHRSFDDRESEFAVRKVTLTTFTMDRPCCF